MTKMIWLVTDAAETILVGAALRVNTSDNSLPTVIVAGQATQRHATGGNVLVPESLYAAVSIRCSPMS
jgi:hypothetical protein